MDNPYLHHLTLEQLQQPVPGANENDATSQEEIDMMLHLMLKARLPALAAPQLGVRDRVVAVDLSRTGGSPIVLVDPTVEWASGEHQSDLEGCPSLPEVRVRVARPVQVIVRANSRNGQIIRLHAGGLLARILQHTIDHLNGVSLLDHLGPREQDALRRRLRHNRPRCPMPASSDEPEKIPPEPRRSRARAHALGAA